MGPEAVSEDIIFSYKGGLVIHPGLLRKNKLSPRTIILTSKVALLDFEFQLFLS